MGIVNGLSQAAYSAPTITCLNPDLLSVWPLGEKPKWKLANFAFENVLSKISPIFPASMS